MIVQRNSPATLLGNVFGAIPITLIFSGTDYSTSVYIWLGALYLITLLRWIHYRVFNRSLMRDEDPTLHGYIQCAGVFIAGSIWGSAGVFLFDADNPTYIVAIVLTFVCMLAGSLASLSARPRAYVVFALPVMVPLIVNMVIQEQAVYQWMAFGATAYLAATFAFCLSINRVIVRSLSLQYENMDLILDLREQKERADKANKDKSRFLASASHDLRQPLHAVNLLAEVLGSKVREPEQKQDLNNIKHGLNSLNDLLDVLLDISRLDAEAVKADKVCFDIDELLTRLEQLFAVEARRTGVMLSVSHEKHIVDTDPILLERVITNLLVNAFRYTKEGEVRVFFTTRKGEVDLHIVDTGIGIDREHLEQIFEEFFQVGNKERNRQKGLGLGLAIVRRILSLLDHRLQIRSEPGVGTELVITLPLGQSEPALSQEKPNPLTQTMSHNRLSGVRVLLVDNEVDIVRAMNSLLSGWGCECQIETSTESALQALETGYRPDLLLVDYRMPGHYNGCIFVDRARSVIGDIPALIITGETSEEVMSEIATSGLVCLHKPLRAAQLRTLMTRLLNTQSVSTA
ncbi:Two-component hybrid sensor and regulator [Marinobacterium lacunae]|uniref:histidine kinase n=1 Tax=Marinobacterium lacunae TaxID=1232683 RepID=A0A081FWM4_9GAMM|nr:Two-component hybrid sensor and regulator [Marinobacterium lacunae]